MKIKLLFVPATMPSHIIPLMALARLLRKNMFECAFLLPAMYHTYVQSLGFTVLEIDRKQNSQAVPELMAIGAFNPDIIVDDLSYTTAFSTKLAKLPRISVVRKGVIPFESNIPAYNHSAPLEAVMNEVMALNWAGVDMWKPNHYSELFIGDVNIIPSVPSVEVLPAQLENKSAYLYAGPLLLSDEEIMRCAQYLPFSLKKNRRTIEEFLAIHHNRKIVYFTTGLTVIPEIHNRLEQCIRLLLDKGVAIITNEINPITLAKEEKQLVYNAPLLPMYKVCSNVDFMIHHCGSGTYSYQLSCQLPAIILGSRLYDRDEVAIRLDELDSCCYISADLDDQAFYQKFDAAASALLDPLSDMYSRQKAALVKLNKEIIDTQNRFNFEEVVTAVYNPIQENER
jgi:UDP:flavonoid glycosyltransferase YjiC (YdhE family)